MPGLIAEILVLFVSSFRGPRGRRSMALLGGMCLLRNMCWLRGVCLLGSMCFLGAVRRNIAVPYFGVASPVVRLIVVVLHKRKPR